jgi:hypothetical protein
MGASSLALLRLGTDTGADFGEVAGPQEYPGGAIEITVLRHPKGQGNVVVKRTGIHAGSGNTLKAAGGLGHGHLGSPGEVDLVEVAHPDLGRLLGDLHRRNTQAGFPVDLL